MPTHDRSEPRGVFRDRPMTVVDVIRLREDYAHDSCSCGHFRRTHYDPLSGATIGCRAGDCTCQNYAWSREADAPH